MVLYYILRYCMVLHCWVRRAGCISQDTYLLYYFQLSPGDAYYQFYKNAPCAACLETSDPSDIHVSCLSGCVQSKDTHLLWSKLFAADCSVESILWNIWKHKVEKSQTSRTTCFGASCLQNAGYKDTFTQASCKRHALRRKSAMARYEGCCLLVCYFLFWHPSSRWK